MIKEFKGEYKFLSNFYSPCKVVYEGIEYTNSEAAYQAQKDPMRALEFVELEPGDAKKLGRSVTIRSDWEDRKDGIMFRIVYDKFMRNPNLMDKLIQTSDQELQEGNTWGDSYWGIYKGEGQNKLGKILMIIRDCEIDRRRFRIGV